MPDDGADKSEGDARHHHQWLQVGFKRYCQQRVDDDQRQQTGSGQPVQGAGSFLSLARKAEGGARVFIFKPGYVLIFDQSQHGFRRDAGAIRVGGDVDGALPVYPPDGGVARGEYRVRDGFNGYLDAVGQSYAQIGIVLQ